MADPDAWHNAIIRTTLGGIVIALTLVACQEGPGSTSDPTKSEAERPSYTTRIFSVRASDFAIQGVSGAIASIAAVEFSMPEITKEVIDKGLVQAHVESPDSRGVWTALPITVSFTVSGIDVTLSMSYGYYLGRTGVTVTGNVTRSEMALVLSAFDGYRLRLVVGE